MNRLRPAFIVAVAALCLTGCGGGGESSSTSSSTTATRTITATGVEPDETTEFLGATLTTATAGEPGVVVVEVAPGSRSRLKQADVIVEANGKPVASPEELLDAVGETELGDQFTIRVVRGAKRFTLTEVQSPTAFLGTQVEDGKEGAAVVAVASGSPAAEGGVQEGDVIVAVDGATIRSGDELLQAVGARSPGDEVTITVQRGGEEIDLNATLIRNPGASG